MSEQVEQLLLWDRAVRADAYDAVHQMRVTTRKIRSLLTDSQESFGLKESAWVIDELRELANVLGVARDARYSVTATSANWTRWRRSWYAAGCASAW